MNVGENRRRKREPEQVLFCLDGSWKQEAQELSARLREEGFVCRFPAEKPEEVSWESYVRQEISAHTLLFTDNRETARAAALQGAVCVGCERGFGGFFDGAVLVTESLEEMDGMFLEETYLHAKGLPVTIARTKRLILREIMPQDFEKLRRISMREGMEYLMVDGLCAEDFFSEENLQAYIRHVYRFFGYGLWSVLLHDGTLIGCCGLSDCAGESVMPEEGGDLELQFMLDPDYQGKGYGTEMVQTALRCAWMRTEARRLWICCRAENEASQALARRLGFVCLGTDQKGILKFCFPIVALAGDKSLSGGKGERDERSGPGDSLK